MALGHKSKPNIISVSATIKQSRRPAVHVGVFLLGTIFVMLGHISPNIENRNFALEIGFLMKHHCPSSADAHDY